MPGPLILGNTAILECSEGGAKVPIKVLPEAQVMGTTGPVASIADFKPTVNIGPFGKCSILKPPVCAPVIQAPWTEGSPTVFVGGKPALTKDSKCRCTVGGEIKILMPGPPTAVIP